MAKLTIESDEQTLQAAESKARQTGVDVSNVIAEAIRTAGPADLSAHRPQDWETFFARFDGLDLSQQYRFGRREDIYVR